MKARRWRWVVGGTAAAIFAAIAVILLLSRDTWPVPRADSAGDCIVRRGWTPAQVARACGPPPRERWQPKVLSGKPPGYFCSAPCEIRGGRAVLYDCDGRVADVQRVGWTMLASCL